MLQGRLYDIVSRGEHSFTLQFHADHPIYAAHFPSSAITPGVCFIEIVQELLEIIGTPCDVKEVKSLRLLKMHTPDVVVDFNLLLDKDKLRFTVSAKEDVYATGTLLLQVASKDTYNNEEKTVLIIGAGVTGLFTGALLAQHGIKVVLLEQRPQIGGGLDSFRKNGFWWPVGFHSVTSLGKDSWLWDVFRKWNLAVETCDCEEDVIHWIDSKGRNENRWEFYNFFTEHNGQEAFAIEEGHKGVTRFVGDTHYIIRRLKTIIESNGGKILTKKKVDYIEVDSGLVKSVHVGDEIYVADAYVVSVHPKHILDMVSEPVFRKGTQNRILQTEETHGMFGVCVVFKERSFPFLKAIHFVMPDDIYIYTHAFEQNQQWAKTMEIACAMDFKEVEQWKEHRDEDYYRWKESKAEGLLCKVEQVWPNFRECIDSYFTASPLTYRDELGNPEGSMYGLSDALMTNRTKCENMFLTGQNCYHHGLGNLMAVSCRTRDAVLQYLAK